MQAWVSSVKHAVLWGQGETLDRLLQSALRLTVTKQALAMTGAGLLLGDSSLWSREMAELRTKVLLKWKDRARVTVEDLGRVTAVTPGPPLGFPKAADFRTALAQLVSEMAPALGVAEGDVVLRQAAGALSFLGFSHLSEIDGLDLSECGLSRLDAPAAAMVRRVAAVAQAAGETRRQLAAAARSLAARRSAGERTISAGALADWSGGGRTTFF